MKAIKIDVVTKYIYEVDISGDLKSLYTALDCEVIDVKMISDTESLYFDDEGLLHDEKLGAFQIGNLKISGHGLIIGTDVEGDSIATQLTVAQVSKAVKFIDVADLPEPHMEFIPIP